MDERLKTILDNSLHTEGGINDVRTNSQPPCLVSFSEVYREQQKMANQTWFLKYESKF